MVSLFMSVFVVISLKIALSDGFAVGLEVLDCQSQVVSGYGRAKCGKLGRTAASH